MNEKLHNALSNYALLYFSQQQIPINLAYYPNEGVPRIPRVSRYPATPPEYRPQYRVQQSRYEMCQG